MALSELLTGKPTFRTTILDANGKNQLLVIDATISQGISFANELSDHPVERGADITDHVRQKNREIQIEGIISESPLDLDSFAKGLVTSAAGIVGGAAGSLAFGKQANAFGSAAGSVVGSFIGQSLLGESQDKAKDGYNALLQMIGKRKPVTIITSLDRYPNMIMTKLDFPRDNKTGKAVRFSASFREIRIVTALKTTIPINVVKAVNQTATGKADLGSQAPTQKNRSLLKAGSSLLSGGS